MTDRQLFEAIGYVGDDLILAADAPVRRKKRGRLVYWPRIASVAACACIFAAGVAVWRSGTLNPGGDLTATTQEAAETAEDEAAPLPGSDSGVAVGGAQEPAEAAENTDGSVGDTPVGSSYGDSPRAVMLGGTVYYETCTALEFADDRSDGTIESTADASALPTEDGQSNFGTGYRYRIVDDSSIAVEIDGSWWEFAAQ